MSLHKTSHELPRVEINGGPRVLRLRADEQFLGMVRSPPGDSGGGAIEVPSRERVEPGERVSVEISFGPMADEITLSGVVHRVTPRPAGKAPLVVIYIVRTHAHRVSYVEQVIEGRRSATARSHRRTPADLIGRWWWGMNAHGTPIRELSRGGTFIEAPSTPKPGFRFDLELRPNPKLPPLRVPSKVIWVSTLRGRTGFGASFRIDDILVANKLASLVRSQESVAPAW
jgi:hypothetical protein